MQDIPVIAAKITAASATVHKSRTARLRNMKYIRMISLEITYQVGEIICQKDITNILMAFRLSYIHSQFVAERFVGLVLGREIWVRQSEPGRTIQFHPDSSFYQFVARSIKDLWREQSQHWRAERQQPSLPEQIDDMACYI